MGPLKEIKMVEVGGIGPGPFCATMLADMGAEVIRVDRRNRREGPPIEPKYNVWHRNRRSICVDIGKPEGEEIILELIENSDALIEGFRPGLMERLNLGPDLRMERNPNWFLDAWAVGGKKALSPERPGTILTTSPYRARLVPSDYLVKSRFST